MAYSPVSPPPQFHVDGSPASGYYLKAYRENTTTAIQMATDSTGGTLVNKIQLNSEGYPEVSGTIVVPHIDEAYKLALYPDETSADNDSTGSAIWLPDNLQSGNIPSTYIDSVDTLTDLRSYSGEAKTILLEGESASGDGSGAFYYFASGASPGTYTDDGDSVIVPTDGDGSAAYLKVVLKNSNGSVLAFGVGGTISLTTSFQAITWSQEDHDTDDIHSTSSDTDQFVIPSGFSYVRGSAQIAMSSIGTSDAIELQFTKNASAALASSGGINMASSVQFVPGYASAWVQVVLPKIPVSENDVIRLEARNASSAAGSITNSSHIHLELLTS